MICHEYIKQDFVDLRTQALRDYTDGKIDANHPAMRITEGEYLFMRYGKYEVILKYMLPGGIQGSQAKIDFKNPLKYRM